MQNGEDKAFSKNPAGERRHGEALGEDKLPTVQRYNSQERQKREEAKKQEQYARKKGLARVVRDPITGGKVQILDSSGDPKRESEDMHVAVPRRNIVSSGGETDIKECDFNSEGTFVSELKDDPNTEQHLEHFGQFVSKMNPGALKHSNSRRNASTKADSKANNQQQSDKSHQRECGEHTNAHDEDGWVDLPMRGQRTNIMYYTLPDPDFDVHHDNVMRWFAKLPLVIFAGECFRYFIIDFGRLTAIVAYLMAGYWIKEQMEKSWTNVKLDTVKRRADQALAKRVPESVEWLNALITAVWKQINPEIFTAAVDKLEDIMQASAPKIVHAIKIDDLGHGDHPVRLLNMRYLDEKEVDEDRDNKNDGDHAGEFVNMEVSVAYSAKESRSEVASKVKNMHLLIILYGGLRNVVGVPIPVWVEIEGFIATLRLRMQFTPDFPYIKNTTASLMGIPKFDISVVPILQRLINITNLPLISSFVQKSIKAACNEYVAPKSYTIDIGQILAGDGIARECTAVGVIVVHLHRAEGLQAQDKGGLSDPYLVVSLSNYGRPIYSSRIIEKTVHPLFEETCFVLVTPESLRSKERLSLQLWDSDRLTADDENGRVEFDIQDLVRNGGSLDHRSDALVGSVEGSKVPGKMIWSVGYFSKRPCNTELATDGSDAHLDEDIRKHPDLKDRQGLPDLKAAKAVSYCPPDPEWPSGILHIQIHQIVDLYANEPKGSWKSDLQYSKGQDTSNPEIEEDEEQSPSAYCTIILNDQLIYKTRQKPFSSKPFFNAGTERFVRDWRTAVCLVAVRDSRRREHDALLGVVPLKLSEVFRNASQVSKNYPLIGGVGEAKVRISMLWESIDHHLPKSLLGWDVGNVRITSQTIDATDLTGDGRHLKHMKLKIFSNMVQSTIRGRACHKSDKGLSWDTHVTKTDLLELPIVDRHASAICIEFHGRAKRGAYAIAVFWATEILDNKHETIELAIWRTETDEHRYQIRQNRVRGENDIRGMQKLGHLKFNAIFLRGLGESHGKQVHNNSNLRQVHECWQATIAHGQRERGGAFLVGHDRRGDNAEPIGQDPYAQLNDCAENAKHGSDPESRLPTDQGEAIDEDGERITNNTSTWAAEEINKVESIAASQPSRSHIYGQDADHDYDRSHHQSSSSQMNGKRHSTTSDVSEAQLKEGSDPYRWSDAWLDSHHMGKPVSDNSTGSGTQADDRRGSIQMTKSRQRQSMMFSDSGNDTSSDETETTESMFKEGTTNEEERKLGVMDHLKKKRMERQRLHREQRGSMQFKPMRTLKWAKDGVMMGTSKISDRFKMRVREPDVQPEV